MPSMDSNAANDMAAARQEPSWWEIRQPTGAECDQTGASMDGVVLVHQGDVVALHDEYGTVTLCLGLEESEHPEPLREWIANVVEQLGDLSEKILKERKR